MTESEVIDVIRARIAKSGSVRALAREWNVSPSYLCDLRDGRRAPGPKILEPFGMRRVVRVEYVKAK